jgi:hypothetical protein
VEPERLDALAAEVDAFVSCASKTLRFGLCAMLDVLRWAPLFLIGRWRTFDELPRAERTRVLHAMERSKLAQLTLIVVAYKTVMTVLFFESEAELRAVGYTGAERHRYKRALALAPRAEPLAEHADHAEQRGA